MTKNGKILEKMTKNENFQINEKKWKFSNKWEKMRKMRKNDDLTAWSHENPVKEGDLATGLNRNSTKNTSVQ